MRNYKALSEPKTGEKKEGEFVHLHIERMFLESCEPHKGIAAVNTGGKQDFACFLVMKNWFFQKVQICSY